MRESGQLKMELGGVGNRGNRYRLRSAAFSITGPVNHSFSSDDFLGQDQAVIELPVGGYTIALASGWFLERLTVNGYRRVETATLLSPSETSFGIGEGVSTGVLFEFQVGEEVVGPVGDGNGSVVIITTVREEGGSGLCGNGMLDPNEACDDGNVDPCDGCAGCEVHAVPPVGPIDAPPLITEDTIWCAAQSPIHVANHLVVLQGATLFVGPGTRVEAGPDVELQIRGAIRIHGDGDAPAVFTSSDAAPVRGSWGGIRLISNALPSVVDAAQIEFADNGLQGFPCCERETVVRHSRFTNNVTGLTSVGRIEDSVFIGNTMGVHGSNVDIQDSVFEDNAVFAVGAARSVLRSRFVHNGLEGNSVFLCGPSGCGLHGVAVQFAERIESSTFLRNDVAFANAGELADSEVIANNVAFSSVFRLSSSLITDNTLGPQFLSGEAFANTIVRNGGDGMRVAGNSQLHGNALCNTGALELRAVDLNFVSATENHWCVTDATAIAARIFDVFDDNTLGPIVFEPFLTAAPPAAPADPGPPAEGPPGSGG